MPVSATTGQAKHVDIAVVALPGMLDAALGITLSVVQAANAIGRRSGAQVVLNTTLVSPATGRIVSAAGQPIATAPLAAAARADVILIPGAFVDGPEAMQVWLASSWMPRWLRFVARTNLERIHCAASCAGTWLLAEAGLLDGRQATTVWWLAPAFRARYPKVLLDTRSIVVSDGPVTTAGAALAHTDLMLHLVARWAGASLADHCARVLMADLRDVQTRHVNLAWMVEADPFMRRMHRWIAKHMGESVVVTDIAAAMHVTTRTLTRRTQRAIGVTPWQMVQRQRIEASAILLRDTRLPFEKIARRVGYADATALRRLIQRELGVAPAALRR